MGSNAIISVLGFIVVFSIISTTLNKRNAQAYQNTYGYVDYTVGRDIARNSIQVALRKIDTITVLKNPVSSITGNLEGGTFQVDVNVLFLDTTKTKSDTIKLTATSTFNDTIYKIKTILARKQLPLPPSLFKGAFGVAPDSVTFNFNGSKDSIDGRDHDLNGNRLPLSPDSVAAVQVKTVRDSLNVVAGSIMSNLLGTPKIKVDPAISDPNAYSDQFKQIADSYILNNGGGTSNVDGIGDSTNPKIMFLDGTNKTTGKTDGLFHFHGDGWGILVVKGNMKMVGGSTFHGAVILYGNTALSFSASGGNSQVYGGILFGGLNKGTYDVSGNSKVLYSKVALNLFKKINNPFVFQVVDWYE